MFVGGGHGCSEVVGVGTLCSTKPLDATNTDGGVQLNIQCMRGQLADADLFKARFAACTLALRARPAKASPVAARTFASLHPNSTAFRQ